MGLDGWYKHRWKLWPWKIWPWKIWALKGANPVLSVGALNMEYRGGLDIGFSSYAALTYYYHVWVFQMEYRVQDPEVNPYLSIALIVRSVEVSQFIPHAKSHSIGHYLSCIGRYLTDPTRTHQLNWFQSRPTQPPRLAPITFKVKARTRVEWPSHGLRDVEAYQDHMIIPLHHALLQLLHWLVLTTPDHAPWTLPVASGITTQVPVRMHPHSLGGHGCLLRSRGHHVMIVQPHVTHTTSSAGHLASGPGTWGPQPSFPSIYFCLMAC